MPTKTFTADQIYPVFKESPESMFKSGIPTAKYVFREDTRWDGKKMLFIEISSDPNPTIDPDGGMSGRVIPKELLT